MLEKRKGFRLTEDMSAEQLIRTLARRYNLPEELDDETLRTMVGVRYELDLRRFFSNLENYVIAYDVSNEALAEILELSTLA